MATKIRLTRHGSKKKPFYRIVAADGRSPRDGRFLEQLGYYDPTREPAVLQVKLDLVEKWVRSGAQPSSTVTRLMKKAGWKGLPAQAAGSSAGAEAAAGSGA